MKKYLLCLFVLLCAGQLLAHPMPSSIVNLSVHDKWISGETKIPLRELANAVGDQRAANLNDPFFRTYFFDHIKATSNLAIWNTQIQSIDTIADSDPAVGSFPEVVVKFTLTPSNAENLRIFTFNYDAVIHQVVTHSALVYVNQDWSNGIHSEENAQQVGAIQMDVPTGKIFPLEVNLEKGSWWKGFKSMFTLGMQHIKEGTDHLLFLIVLLLPAMLLTNGKQWGKYGGIKYSFLRLLKIVTAFTIGHSITLLIGSLGWVRLPTQPIEVLIAFSILVSAIHAIRPIFPGKEAFVAAGFGLIHGLAFATVLSSLDLSAGKLIVSILGFNLGIEIMQLFVIAIIIPWLIILSKTVLYSPIRIIGAILASVAATGWIIERVSANGNSITASVQKLIKYAPYLLILLAIAAVLSFAWRRIWERDYIQKSVGK